MALVLFAATGTGDIEARADEEPPVVEENNDEEEPAAGDAEPPKEEEAPPAKEVEDKDEDKKKDEPKAEEEPEDLEPSHRRINPSRRSGAQPTKSDRRTPTNRDRDDRAGPTDEIVIESDKAFDMANFEKPPEEREYRFSLHDVEYSVLMKQWARMTGLPVIGETPGGSDKVNYVSSETVDYKGAFNRVCLLLFQHKDIYWMIRDGNHFEVMRMTEVPRNLRPSDVYTSVEALKAAGLDENDVAMLLYTPPSGSVEDLEPIMDFMPDYFRTAPFESSNSRTLFGLVGDIYKYLAYVEIFSSVAGDLRMRKHVAVEHILPTKAVELLEELIADDHSGGSASGRRRTEKSDSKSETPRAGGPPPTTMIPFDEHKWILVLAMEKKIAEIEKLLKLIDVPAAEEFPIEVIPLKHAQAQDIATIIEPLAADLESSEAGDGKGKNTKSGRRGRGSSGGIIPEARTNSLVVLGDEEHVARVRKLVDVFDVETEDLPRTVDIAHVDPAELIETVTKLMSKPRGGGKREGGDNRFVIEVAPTGDRVIISGDKSTLDEAEKIIAQLDVPPGGDAPTLHQAKLINSKAAALAEVLGKLDALDGKSAGTGAAEKGKRGTRRNRNAESGPFFGDDVTNTLFVMCTEKEWTDKYWPMIQQFDREAEEVGDAVLLTVTHLAPQEALTTLKELYPEGAKRRGGAGGGGGDAQESIRYAVAPNGVIVANASPAQVTRLRETLLQFDVDPLAGIKLERKIFEFEHAQAEEVQTLVETMLADSPSSGRPESRGRSRNRRSEGGSDAPGAAAEDIRMSVLSGNRLMVHASTEKLAEIDQFIASLDGEVKTKESVVRTVKLVHADPLEMRDTVKAMVEGTAPSPRPRRPTRRGEEGTGGGESIQIGGSLGVTVSVLPGGQTLVLAGQLREVDEVETWIKDLDAQASGKEVLKVYFPIYNDPWQLAETIMAFVDSAPKGKGAERQAKKPEPKEGGGFFDDLLDDFGDMFEVQTGPLIGQEIIINVDSFQGSMLVKTTPAKLRMVEQIYAMYEGENGEPPDMPPLKDQFDPIVFELENADPYDAAYRLKAYLVEAWPHGDPLPTVTEATFSEALIVNADPKYVKELEQIIAQYVDITDSTLQEEVSETIMVTGTVPSAIAAILQGELTDVEIDMTGADMDKLEKLIPRLDPFDPDSPEEKAKAAAKAKAKNKEPIDPCLLPASALRALLQASPGQTASDVEADDEDEDADEEPDRQPTAEEIADSIFGASPSETDEAESDEDGEAEAVSRPLKIRVDDKTREIILEGPRKAVEDARTRIEEILTQIKEEETKPVDIRVYQLRYQDVEWAAQVLEAMFNLKKKSSGATPQQIQQQIKAMQEAQKAAQQRQTGRQGQEGKPEQQDPQAAAMAALQQSQQGTGALHVFPNPKNQTLIMRAATEDFPMILELLATIDRPGDKPYEFRIFPLEKRRAEDVEELLNFILGLEKASSRAKPTPQGQSNNPQQMAQQLQQQMQLLELEGMDATPLSSSDKIIVTSDLATNSLVVRAPKVAMPLITELVQDLEEQFVPETVIQTFALLHADAAEVVTQLETLFPESGKARVKGGGKGAATREEGVFDPSKVNAPTFVADARVNRIIVKALDVDMEEIEEKINLLDIEVEEGGDKVLSIRLKWANPESVARTLTEVYKDRGGKGKGGAASAIRIVGDADNNTLLVTAPIKLREEIMEQIAAMDTPEGSRPRLIKIEQAVPSELVKVIQAVYGEGGGKGGRGRSSGFGATADDESGQIIIVAPDDVFEDVKKLVADLDSPELVGRTDAVTTVYPIKYADPDGVVQAITSMNPRGQSGGARGSAKDRISAVVENSTQSVVVTASPDSHEKIVKLIADLDVDSGAVVKEIYKMTEAQASEVAEIVNKSLQQRGPQKRQAGQQLSVVANDSTNALVVYGTRKDVDNAVELVKALDLPPDTTAGRFPEVYTIKYADPSSTKEAIKSAFPRSGKGTKPDQIVDAEYAAGTGSLVVTASKENHEKVVTLLSKIDLESTSKRTVHIIKLKEANAEDLAQKFQMFYKSIQRQKQGGEVPMQVFGDPGTNSLVIYSTEEELAEIRALLVTVDIKPDYLADRLFKSFKLEYAESWSVHEMILAIFEKRQGRQSSPKDMVSAYPDWSSNSIVVSASADNMAEIERLIGEVDRKDSGQRSVHVLRVQHKDAAAVNQGLNDIFVKGGTGRRGQQTISITNPRDTDTLLVKANVNELADIKAALAEMDIPGSDDVPQIIPLVHVTPSQIAPTLTKLYVEADRRGGRSSGGTVPVIEANDAAKTLLVKADTADFNSIKSLVEKLDVPGAQLAGGVEIIPVQKGVDVSELADNLEDLLRDAWTFEEQQTGVKRRAAISADVRTNSILVAGDSSRFAEIKQAVAALEKMSPAGGTSHRMIPLKPGSDPEEIKRVLEEVIKAKQNKSGSSRRRG